MKKHLAAVVAVALLIFSPACGGSPTSPSGSGDALSARSDWGPTSAGLRMAISSVTSENLPPGWPQFDVAIENVGDSDVVLNLGYMLNGAVMFPEAIWLILTDPQGKTRELQYFDRRYPGVAGRMDDFIVALPSGSVYTVRLTLDHYWSPATSEFALDLPGGRYRIAARFDGQGATTPNLDMQGVALLNFWEGTLRSNSIEFDVSGNATSK